jgi:hypothetical protein
MNPNPRITPMLTDGFSENSRIDGFAAFNIDRISAQSADLDSIKEKIYEVH